LLHFALHVTAKRPAQKTGPWSHFYVCGRIGFFT
jgi:hypothetical protein